MPRQATVRSHIHGHLTMLEVATSASKVLTYCDRHQCTLRTIQIQYRHSNTVAIIDATPGDGQITHPRTPHHARGGDLGLQSPDLLRQTSVHVAHHTNTVSTLKHSGHHRCHARRRSDHTSTDTSPCSRWRPRPPKS